jgi:hypothetical protein
MAKLYITEYRRLGSDKSGRIMQTGEQPPLATQIVNITSGSLQSNPFHPSTSLIRVHTDVLCSVEVGLDPVATLDSARMVAGSTEYLAVNSPLKIAVISNT